RDPRAHPPDRVQDHVEASPPVPIPGPPRLPGLTRSSQATRAAHRTPGRSHLLSSGPAPLLSPAAPTGRIRATGRIEGPMETVAQLWDLGWHANATATAGRASR